MKEEQHCWICSAGVSRDAGDISGVCMPGLLLIPSSRLPFLTSMEEILADSEDEEEEEEERQQSKERRKQARQKGQAWLKEGEEDEPLNFLDPNVSQRVLGKEQILRCGWGGMDGAGAGVMHRGPGGTTAPRSRSFSRFLPPSL